jgi:NAD-dependent deacetylase
MRPDIVMYGEALDQGVIEAAVSAIARASVLIVAGTSLVVYPAAGLINYFSGDHLVLMNATPTSADVRADLIIREPVGETLDRVMDQLHARGVLPA